MSPLSLPRATRRALAGILVYLLLLPTNAFAFKQGIHENITETRVKAAGFSNKSADEVGDANWWTDIYEQTSAAAHFDNESLAGGSARLRGKIDSIISNLDNCEKED